MENTKMKKQTDQQQKTPGKTTNRINKKDKHLPSSIKLLRLKAGILDQQICSEPEIPAFDQTRRRPRRLDEDVRKLSIEFMVIKV